MKNKPRFRIVTNGDKFKVQKLVNRFFGFATWCDIIQYTGSTHYTIRKKVRSFWDTLEEAKTVMNVCIEIDVRNEKIKEIENRPWKVVEI